MGWKHTQHKLNLTPPTTAEVCYLCVCCYLTCAFSPLTDRIRAVSRVGTGYSLTVHPLVVNAEQQPTKRYIDGDHIATPSISRSILCFTHLRNPNVTFVIYKSSSLEPRRRVPVNYGEHTHQERRETGPYSDTRSPFRTQLR